ncbi:MAG: SatD family protein [Anaerolineales bacterium]
MAKGVYLAVIGDIVGSKTISNRGAFQRRLARAITSANKSFAQTIASRFVLTVGDEFQGLLAREEQIVAILASLRSAIHPVELRFGIGVGRINTPLRPEALGMDGPCFHYGRGALERAAARGTPVEVEAGTLQEPFSIYALLYSALRGRWTQRQRQVIDLAMSGMEGKRIASRLSISPPAVTQHLAAARWKEIEEATRNWQQALAWVHQQVT